MNYILFDDETYYSLLPLTHTRPVASLRCGIFTMQERWQFAMQQAFSFKTKEYLQEKFQCVIGDDNLLINGSVFYSNQLNDIIDNLNTNEYLALNDLVIAVRLSKENASKFNLVEITTACKKVECSIEINRIEKLSDIFSKNDFAIRYDYELLARNRTSQTLPNGNHFIGNTIFIEEGAKISCSILNSETGPIYIGRDAEIMEGCIVRGPFAMGEHSVLKMGAKIYGATTLGDGCKIGGEVNNTVFYANSSKAHDGFIGNSVIGEWCNLGADSNNSNLKNNYEEVKLWSEYKQSFLKTGLQFCGLILGDHSKCGINTMFNTGTVVGVSCNIFGAGFPRNFIPSFSWGGAQGFTEYKLNKANETASKVFARRNLTFDEVEKKIMQTIFDVTVNQRVY
jgi:UDP-N-acetylglucosamine diphosphorylase/glucosamine-1-phosphate N-acetyltransferase